jgi:hypothetical protein
MIITIRHYLLLLIYLLIFETRGPFSLLNKHKDKVYRSRFFKSFVTLLSLTLINLFKILIDSRNKVCHSVIKYSYDLAHHPNISNNYFPLKREKPRISHLYI